ncbi:MAG: hypothetical protein SGJ16_12455 [Nitrospirota bacterium]|nr:hypothetical protein [Nitrospirota bacterium]
MAGSQQDRTTVSAPTDPILAARLEAIKQLASGVSERVAVMDRDFNVIYANESAWSEEAVHLSDRQAKCYEAFAHRLDPCGTCPATKMYESTEVQSVACSLGGDGTACGMHQAFPLVSSRGAVESVLVLFKTPPPATQTSGERREAQYESKLGELIGSSAPMRAVLDMVRLVADSSATLSPEPISRRRIRGVLTSLLMPACRRMSGSGVTGTWPSSSRMKTTSSGPRSCPTCKTWPG